MPDGTSARTGWAIAFALVALGIPSVPVEYAEAVQRLSHLCKVAAPYERPASGRSTEHADATSLGLFSKVPPAMRLVREELNCWRHAEAARELFFPQQRCGRVGAQPGGAVAADAPGCAAW